MPRPTVDELYRLERYLRESIAEYFAATGADRARARAILAFEITRWRVARRAFYGSK